jgi:hypothetical protein
VDRPTKERETAILDAIRNAFSPEEVTDLLREAITLAREQKSARGIIAALTPVLEYSLGRPAVKLQTTNTKFQDLLSMLGSDEPGSGEPTTGGK